MWLWGFILKIKREKEENKIAPIYKYIYQAREIINILGILKKIWKEILEKSTLIDEDKIDNIERYYFEKLHAIIIKLDLEYNWSFGFIKDRKLLNIALQKDDRNFIKLFQKGFYGIENQYYIDEIIEEDLINTINKCMKSGKPNNKIIWNLLKL